MFTVLWKTPNGGEEIYVAPSVAKIPALSVCSKDADCEGRAHLAFQRLDGYAMTRTLIDMGEVFVMNSDGKTVATYRF